MKELPTSALIQRMVFIHLRVASIRFCELRCSSSADVCWLMTFDLYPNPQVKDGKSEEELQVSETTIPDKPDLTVFRIDLPRPLAAKETVTVDVETVFIHTVLPFPREISQNDKQLVQFAGNAYVFLPYPTKTQSTNIILPQKSSIEAFTKVSPVNTNENEITYGPYSNLPAYSYTKIQLHYENNGPFIGLVSLERVIEVSHWGNIAVEEHFHIKHFGKQLCLSVCTFPSFVCCSALTTCIH